MKNNFSSRFDIIIDNVACTWTAFSIRITMWESDIFESSEEEPPSKKRDTRNKNPAKTGCSRQRKMLKKAEKQSIILKIKSLTAENIATVSDVASCNHRVFGGTICFGIESVMIVCDETNLDTGATPHINMKYQYQTFVTGFFHFDFSSTDTYLQPFTFGESVNI